MKKYIFLLLFAVFAFCGCTGSTSDAKITLVQTSKDQVEISGDGGKVKVAFASALDWYVETQDTWLHVTPDRGVAGNGVITVEADKNMDIEKRTGVVNICSEDVVFPVKIIQKPYEATFEMLESEKTVSCLGGNMILKVNADVDYEYTIDADWIKAADSKAASVRQHQFNVEPNLGEQRTAVVSFHYGAMTKTVTVIQRAVGTEADDWQLGEFAHRSLAMRFTADWCGYCPYMAVAFKNAKSQMGDRLELVSLHGDASRYEFSGTATLERRFKASSYPTGIVDARVSIPNYSSTATTTSVTVAAAEETVNNYPTTVGITCASSIKGSELTVDVSLYIKQADSYKIVMLLLEDDIIGYQNGIGINYEHDGVARLAITPISGDSIKTEGPEIWSGTYTAELSDKWKKENLRILIYVEKAYGDLPKVETVEGADYDNFGEFYIDNCRAVQVGVAAELEVL